MLRPMVRTAVLRMGCAHLTNQRGRGGASEADIVCEKDLGSRHMSQGHISLFVTLTCLLAAATNAGYSTCRNRTRKNEREECCRLTRTITMGSRRRRDAVAPLALALASFLPLVSLGGTSNIGVHTVRSYQGPVGSDFGFAVGLLPRRSASAEVLVGAPRAGAEAQNNSRTASGGGGVGSTGALFRCPLGGDLSAARCVAAAVDTAAVLLAQEGGSGRLLPAETKVDQLLGMTLSASVSGAVVTCAPHYMFNGRTGDSATMRRDPTGNCFFTPDIDRYNFSEASPCRQQLEELMISPVFQHSYPAIHETGSGMCGFSVAASVGLGDYLFAIGAPGSFYWHGQLYVQTAALNTSTASPSASNPEEDIYFGYAVAVGRFSQAAAVAAESRHIVASAPRANLTRGQLCVFSSSNMIHSLACVVGDQVGSYLGYALAAADVDGNGVDDVVAGAPMWTDYGAERPEVGALYVYRWMRDSPSLEFSSCPAIRGSTAHGRFGLAVAAAGDLNLDGVADVVVGAPYGGPDGRGAVYVYRGKQGGCLMETPVQVIFASDVVSSLPLPLTFGWSLAASVDVDGNGYPDVAVGAYKSSTAYLFRSQPIILTNVSLQTQPESVSFGGDCDDSFVSGGSSSRNSDAFSAVAEFNVSVCVGFTPAGRLREPSSATFRVTVVLDDEQPLSRRAFFRANGLSTASVDLTSPGPRSCAHLRSYLSRGARDKVSPIVVIVTHELLNTTLTGGEMPDAVIDDSVGTLVERTRPRALVSIRKNCRSSACQPFLSVRLVSAKPYYVAGADESMSVDVNVANTGEDAYNTSVTIELPAGVSYVNVQSAPASCPPIACQQEAPGTAILASDSGGSESVSNTMPTRVVCDVGNPLPSGRSANFTLRTRLDDAGRLRSSGVVYFVRAASTVGGQATEANATVVIVVLASASVFVTGTSLPDADVSYNDSLVTAASSSAVGVGGPVVSHRFEMFTEGPTDVDEAELVILWPASLRNGTDHLLRLLGPPVVSSGNGSCTVTPIASVAVASTAAAAVATDGFATVASSPTVTRDTFACVDADGDVATGNGTCTRIVCRLFSLTKSGEPCVVTVDSELWLGQTFARLTSGHSRRATVYSVARSRVVSYVGGLLEVDGSSAGSSVSQRIGSYFVKYRPPTQAQPLDWKWIVIGAVGGLLLLVLIIVVLWRCGFFKRNRPPTMRGVVVKETVPLTSSEDERETEREVVS